MNESDGGASRQDSGEVTDMTPEQAARHLQVIRELMERPLRQTTRSGASGIIAGVLALAGCAATYLLVGDELRTMFAAVEPMDDAAVAAFWQTVHAKMAWVGLAWLGVLVVAAGANLLLTWRRARGLGRRGYWGHEQWQTALAIVPGFLMGGLITAMFAQTERVMLVPGVWMIFYGMAAWSVGLFSPTEVKALGAAFLVAGIVWLAWFSMYPIVGLAVTFGGFHLVYGAIVWARHGG